MTRRLVYLIGGPGSGKSTLMARLTEQWKRVGAFEGLRRDFLIDRATDELAAVELGTRRPAFSGTDALSHSAIGPACDWMLGQRETDLVFGEGARLGVRRFLRAASDAGYDVILGYLDHDDTEEWRLARSRELGREQNPSWVAGRITAARNLAADPPPGVSVFPGHPDVLLPIITHLIHGGPTA